MNFDQVNSKLITFFNKEEYIEDLAVARSEFEKAAGIIDEDADNFESKTRQFHDWFLYSENTKTGNTAIGLASEDGHFREEKDFLVNASAARHSMFELLKVKKDIIKIRDLFTKEKLKIKNNYMALEYHVGDYFEARVIEHEKVMQFTGSFCFHPDEVKKYILKHIKPIRKIKDDDLKKVEIKKLIFKLFRMRHKLNQYKHLSADKIYADDSQFNL